MDYSTHPLKYLRTSALSLYPTVALCVALRPSAVMTHYGISYYGNLRATLLPFCIGLATAAYYLWRAALALAADPLSHLYRLSTGLKLMAVSMFGIVVTPSLSTLQPLRAAHVLFGTSIFAGATVLSVRYMVWMRCALIDWLLLACEVLAVVVAVLSFEFLGAFRLMLPAQLVAATAFSLLLLRAVGAAVVRQVQDAELLRVALAVRGSRGLRGTV